MYCSFYGIREKPFSITPDPRFLYLGRTHKEAFAHLLYGIRERGGFIVVTGEIGTGKTTLCRALLSHLDADTLVAFIFNPALSALDLLKSINEDFGISSKAGTKKELIDELNRFLLEKREEGKNTVLIIDEAQSLDGEVLEQIRLLSNLETETEKLLQIILIGQPEFRNLLEQPRLLQLNQRVTVRYHLQALSAEETIEYVHHRLSIIDGQDKIFFSPDALKKVFRYTRGVPRLINVLCDRALLAGYSLRRRHIDGKMIDQAHKEVSGHMGWNWSGRLTRLLRQGLVPGAVLAMLVVLFALGLGFLFDNARREVFLERTVQGRLAGSEVSGRRGVVGPSPSIEAGTSQAPSPLVPGRKVPGHEEGVRRDGLPSRVASWDHAEAGGPRGIDVPGGVLAEGPLPGGEGRGSTTGFSPSKALPDSPDEGLAQAFLEAFSARTLLETREGAFLAVVDRWGHAGSEEARRRLYREAQDLFRAAGALGFRCLRLRGNLNRIRALNLPALLELRLGETMEKRYVALLGFQGGYAMIAPGLPDGTSSIPLSVLESFWYGTAYVLWRDVWGGRRMLKEGMKGRVVLQVQASLQELGYYDQEPSGIFDRRTMEAIRAFQRDHCLEEDGILGPQTKIVLYQTLNHVPMPRLEEAAG